MLQNGEIMEEYCFYCMDRLSENGTCDCERLGREHLTIPGAIKPGTVLNGKYLIGHPLGAGGFGITYIGRDLMLDMKVAVKEYTEGAPGGKERFLREARAMARFSGNPGIVNVRDFFETDGTAYIVMEYLDGITLKEYIAKTGPLSWDKTLAYMQPVLAVLEKIHKEGYIHRDVSPDNIMMLKDGSVKLLDFGSAADVSRDSQRTMTVMLKPGYAPPEQYQGKGGMGAWTDVYSVCATLYKCITGETPTDSLTRMFEDSLKAPSALGIKLDPEVEQILMKGLAVRKDDRILSVDGLARGLQGPMSSRQSAAPLPGEKAVSSYGEKAVSSYGEKAVSSYEKKAVSSPGKKAAAVQDGAPVQSGGPGQKAAPKKKPSKGTKNKKVLWISLAGAAALIFALFIVLIFSGSIGNTNPYRSDNSSLSYLKDLTVTDKMIDIINHDEETLRLNLDTCVITDEQLAQICKNPRIDAISLTQCSGFTTLESLAVMPSLRTLKLDVGTGGSVDGSTLFPTTFNFVGELHLYSDVVLTSGTEFLNNFPNMVYLYMAGAQGVDSLAFLENMPNIVSLNVNDVPLGDKDYSALSGCTALMQLDANNTGISDLTVLAPCTKLSSLGLRNCQLTDLSPLAAMADMVDLKLDDNQISDITPLAGMTKMNALILSNNQITDLTPLAGMAQMLNLYVDNNQITDLTPLAAMGKLLNINVRNNKIQSLDGCQAMISLMGFWAANNELTDINGLKSSTSLKTLDLQNNKISDAGMFSNGFTELVYLNLSDNELSDISSLTASAKLRALVVENNRLTSLDGLENKPELVGIMANHNQITDISALSSSMASLQYVDLGSNEISDISVFSNLVYKKTALLLENNNITGLESLPSSLNYRLSIYGNPITDYSPMNAWENVNFVGDLLYIDYNAQADIEPLLKSGFGNNFYIVDAPLEEQAAILRLAEEVQENMFQEPTFVTREQADEAMASFRAEIKKNLGGDPSDDSDEQ